MSENQSLLRLQSCEIAPIELENQYGPLQRQLLTIVVSEMFPKDAVDVAQTISIVIDPTQAAAIALALSAGVSTKRPDPVN